jgi:hypothetical protein
MIFIASPKSAPENVSGVREAPITLLLPQFAMVAGIVILSFFPKLLMDKVSAAIDPHFAASTVWQGMSLKEIYAMWNPLPIMATALALAALSLLLCWVFYRIRRNRIQKDEALDFFDFYKTGLAILTMPAATRLWEAVSSAVSAAGAIVRRIYTGNGQTYALHVLYYVLAVYFAGFHGGGF